MECLFVYPILANRPVSLGSGRSLASTEREDGTVVLLAHINIAAGRESSTWWLSVSTLTFEGGICFAHCAYAFLSANFWSDFVSNWKSKWTPMWSRRTQFAARSSQLVDHKQVVVNHWGARLSNKAKQA